MNHRAFLASAITCCALGAPAAEGLRVHRPETVGMSSERLARVTAWVDRYIESDQIAGAVTLIARRGKVVHFEAQGWRYKEEDQPMAKDTIFTIMSMTKPIVSMALMMLHEEGRFLLDDPISEWLPEYESPQVLVHDGGATRRVPANGPITVRHVLTHTSGLQTRPINVTLSAEDQLAFEADGERPRNVGELLERAAVIPLMFQPGEHWQYGSSTDYVAVLVEKISGRRLDELLQERIFDPLGMVDTHYNVPEEKTARKAAFYTPDEAGKIDLRGAPEYREPSTMFHGTYGLSSTAEDYFKFAQMLLNGGEYGGHRFLGRRTIELSISNHLRAGQSVYVRGPGYGFGLGFGVLIDPTVAKDTLSAGSFTWGGALGTLFWIDPVEELIGILMVQIAPYDHFNLRPELSLMASQAIVDPHPKGAPRVIGHLK